MNQRTIRSLIRVWGPVLLLLALVGLRYCWQRSRGDASPAPAEREVRGDDRQQPTERQRPTPARATTDVPAYALQVLAHVRAHGEAPDGYVGGRAFQNRENRLPKKTPAGETIRYREWDVHPKEPGKNRGPERLVTGSDQSAYFTADHYRTFVKIE